MRMNKCQTPAKTNPPYHYRQLQASGLKILCRFTSRLATCSAWRCLIRVLLTHSSTGTSHVALASILNRAQVSESRSQMVTASLARGSRATSAYALPKKFSQLTATRFHWTGGTWCSVSTSCAPSDRYCGILMTCAWCSTRPGGVCSGMVSAPPAMTCSLLAASMLSMMRAATPERLCSTNS